MMIRNQNSIVYSKLSIDKLLTNYNINPRYPNLFSIELAVLLKWKLIGIIDQIVTNNLENIIPEEFIEVCDIEIEFCKRIEKDSHLDNYLKLQLTNDQIAFKLKRLSYDQSNLEVKLTLNSINKQISVDLDLIEFYEIHLDLKFIQILLINLKKLVRGNIPGISLCVDNIPTSTTDKINLSMYYNEL